MKSFTIRLHLIPFVGWIVGTAFVGCVAFDPVTHSTVEDLNERPIVAILPFGFDLEITTLSAVKTVDETLSPEDEAKYVAETLWEIQTGGPLAPPEPPRHGTGISVCPGRTDGRIGCRIRPQTGRPPEP